MNIIKDDATLRQFLPNAFSPINGEKTFFEKLTPWLSSSEDWFLMHFCDADTFSKIIAKPGNNIEDLAKKVVVFNALITAIPSLDLVLTPNGFGIVNTESVIPASAERIERLLASLFAERDNNIDLLLNALPSHTEWQNTEQYLFFSSTLFPSLDFIKREKESNDRWAKFLELRPSIIDIEGSIAEDYFSSELMNELRVEWLEKKFKPLHAKICDEIRAQILAALKMDALNSTALMRIVNTIRHHAEEFPNWHNSETAKLFNRVGFQNKKENKAYFF